MRRRILLLGLAVIAVLFLLNWSLRLCMGRMDRIAASSSAPDGRISLILDAGHGGEDGGAVSITGVPESQINLAVVLKTRDILAFYGVSPLVLREEDISLHDDSAVSLREKKVSDLKNRVAAIEEQRGATLLSIHQNTYPNGRYHGAQAFYAPTEGSKELAEHIQAAIRSTLQPDNERAVKQIPDTVYLMNHISCPAVLVECGFLTNPGEEALLLDPDYQKQLAAVLAGAWLTAP